MSTHRATFVSGLLLLLGMYPFGSVAAQIPGDIDYVIPGGVAGVTVNVEYGRGLNNESGKTDFGGGRIVVTSSRVSVWGGGGFIGCGPCSGIDAAVGGGLAVHTRPGPEAPVALSFQVGVGYSNFEGTSIWGVPIGVGLVFDVPSTGVDVQPWLMPLVLIERGGSQTEVGGGVSGGLNLSSPAGFGLHLALEWVTIDGSNPVALGVGLHYRVSVPSLGM